MSKASVNITFFGVDKSSSLPKLKSRNVLFYVFITINEKKI